MEYKFIEEEIVYTGEQLRSHWIWEKTGILGDCIVGFFGPAEVYEHLLDVVDRRKKSGIYAKRMMHFICEHFDTPLSLAIARQRILICIIAECINAISCSYIIERRGNDLYYKGGKLSVSIAASSPISSLIHVGVNIEAEDVDIKISSLPIINNIDERMLCEKILKAYTEEIKQMHQCLSKARWTK